MQNRRKFLITSLKTAAIVPFLSFPLISCSNQINKKLNILILGGTSFLGPHQIAYALSRGHNISIFTRGKTKPTVHSELFNQVEQLIGDRENDLEALKNRKWDAVIDNSGRNVKWTQDTAELLKDHVDLYLYTSSTGVYYPYLGDNISENTTVLLEEPKKFENEDEKLEYWYGVMKSNSENAVKQNFGNDRSIIVRPTYMIGPADKTDRFIYWPIRLSKGGETLVPGNANDPVQFIDVRDVAEWMIRLIEEKNTNTFNAVGPKNKMGITAFVNEAQKTFQTETSIVQVDDYDFLKKEHIYYIVPWIMPEGKNYGSARATNKKALENGLTYRPIQTSISDIYNWWYSDAVSEEHRLKYETTPKGILAREKEIISTWKQYKSNP